MSTVLNRGSPVFSGRLAAIKGSINARAKMNNWVFTSSASSR
jgi:hypothetical protein